MDEEAGLLQPLADKHIPVLIVGTAAYSFCGSDYGIAFSKMFPLLAAKYGDILYPDFKTGVTGHPELLAGDGDHPNAAGEALVVEQMLPVVEALIDRLDP